MTSLYEKSGNLDFDSDEGIQKREILLQLEDIVRSPEFQGSRRLQDFLNYIVRKTLASDQKSIKQYSIAIDVYHRPASFEPKSEPLIRIEAGRLRRALKRFYENHSQSKVLIEIPSGSYVPVFSKRTSVSSAESLKPPVIGVFPFTYDGNKDNAFIADGLAEELADELCLFPDYQVMAYHTTSQYRNQDDGIFETCNSLGIDLVITGSIKALKDELNMTFRLINVKNGSQIWTKRYIESLSPKNLQSIIADTVTGIVGVIADTNGIMFQHYFKKIVKQNSMPSTFEAILKNHYYHQNISPDTFEEARSALEHALANDPDNATLIACMSIVYLDAVIFNFANIPDAFEIGIQLASKAVTIDPNNQMAHHCRAYSALVSRDQDTMIRSAKRMLEINPKSASMVAAAGFWLCLGGDYEQGMKSFKEGIKLNPKYPRWLNAAPFFYNLHNNNYEEALKNAQEFETPGFYWGHIMRASVLILLDKVTEANEEYQKLLELKADFPEKGLNYIQSFVLDDNLATKIFSGIELVRPENKQVTNLTA